MVAKGAPVREPLPAACSPAGILGELERLAAIRKCRTCRCLADVVAEFGKTRAGDDSALQARLAGLTGRIRVTHECLGCDPCHPAPLSNRIAGMSDREAAPPVSPPSIRSGLKNDWPVEAGTYLLGNPSSPVAICTLADGALPALLAGRRGKPFFSIAGRMETENIGIEKVIRNVVTNPAIRFLMVCGRDATGHCPGQSLLSLLLEGVDARGRIRGARGGRPILKNVGLLEIEHFRGQVEAVDRIGLDDPAPIAREARVLAKRSPGPFEPIRAVPRPSAIEAGSPTHLLLDPAGFFIIHPNADAGTISLEHYRADGTRGDVIHGADPAAIAATAVARGLVSRLDHAVYLGRELERASRSLADGTPYVQDRAPGS
jgi:tetrahydromethanopterin S-methyltransferase subunit A